MSDAAMPQQDSAGSFDLSSGTATGSDTRYATISALLAVCMLWLVTDARASGVANGSATPRDVHVDSALVDAEGSVIAQASITTTLEPGHTSDLRLASFEVDEPELWSPESPYLYRVICTVRDGARVLDRLQHPLGLRWAEFDAKTGFRLNGKPYRLFGTNRHQDYPGQGNALTDEQHRSDLRKIKDNGFNFLRLAHYPQDPAVLEAADEIGLLVWEEIPIVNLIGVSSAFRKNSVRMVREMIRQHRYHPSVIFWGYMNEVTWRRHRCARHGAVYSKADYLARYGVPRAGPGRSTCQRNRRCFRQRPCGATYRRHVVPSSCSIHRHVLQPEFDPYSFARR